MRIKSHRAFTLLELVLVIAILVLFVLLLIPAFHKGKTLKLTPEVKSTPVPEATPEPVIAPLPEEKADPVLPLPAPEKAEPAPPAPEPDGKPSANPKEADGAAERLNKEVAERIERRVASIIIPKLEMHEATIREAIDFLKKKVVELDPEPDPARRGVSIVLKLNSSMASGPPPDASAPQPIPGLESLPGAAPASANQIPVEPRITLSLANVSWLDAMKAVAAQAKLKVVIEPYAVAIVPVDTPAVAAGGSGGEIAKVPAEPAPEK